MELLNSGKIRWVKAILSHLVRCIKTSCPLRADDESLVKQRGGGGGGGGGGWSRSRTMSVSYVGTTSPLESRGSTTQIPEELTLDYAEITSISPLPLWTLLIADKETNLPHQHNTEDKKKDYNELFENNLTKASRWMTCWKRITIARDKRTDGPRCRKGKGYPISGRGKVECCRGC